MVVETLSSKFSFSPAVIATESDTAVEFTVLAAEKSVVTTSPDAPAAGTKIFMFERAVLAAGASEPKTEVGAT